MVDFQSTICWTFGPVGRTVGILSNRGRSDQTPSDYFCGCKAHSFGLALTGIPLND